MLMPQKTPKAHWPNKISTGKRQKATAKTENLVGFVKAPRTEMMIEENQQAADEKNQIFTHAMCSESVGSVPSVSQAKPFAT